jgi:hypothetical protein
MEAKRFSAAPFLIAVAMLLVPLSVYTGAYFIGCNTYLLRREVPPIYVRYYSTSFEARLFWPAAKLESFITGKKVATLP